MNNASTCFIATQPALYKRADDKNRIVVRPILLIDRKNYILFLQVAIKLETMKLKRYSHVALFVNNRSVILF